MGTSLNVLFVWGKPDGKSMNVFAHLYMEKILSELYNEGIFEFKGVKTTIHPWYMDMTCSEDGYGAPYEAIECERFLKYLESKRDLLLKEHDVICDDKRWTERTWFDERFQLLLKMLETLKDHSVVLYWS